VVMGAGAIGSLIGGLLKRAGHTVTLVGRQPHVDAIRANGLSISGLENFTVHPLAATEPPSGDLFLLTVKTYDVSRVLETLPSGNSPVVGFQNGMGSLDEIERSVPEGCALGAVCYVGATFLGPGEVHYAGTGPVYVGPPGGGESSLADDVAGLFSSAGLEASVRPDLLPLLWEELLVNAGINPLTALTGLPNGALAEDPLMRELMLKVVKEGEQVAAAEGVKLPRDAGSLAVKVCRQTANNRSSMLQDLQRGGRTEVDAINGFIVKKAKLYNVPVPVNGALHALVKGRESSGPVK